MTSVAELLVARADDDHPAVVDAGRPLDVA